VRNVYSVAEVRAAENGLPENVLIDRASTAVARRAVSMLDGAYGRRVLVVAGPGHNGADALWAGVKLLARGCAVDVALPLGEPRDEHGAEPLRRLLASGARRRVAHPYDLCLDGVLGVGARAGDGPAPWAGLLRGTVLAVDVPTGVDADTGAAGPGAVRADVTVTFGGLKTGLVVGAGAEHAGLVEVAPIGLPLGAGTAAMVEAAEVARYVAEPDADTDKYRRGVVGVYAGSVAYPGAAVLACRGALRAGCGYVRLVAPRAVADLVRAAYPEVVATEPGDLPKADAWVVGPGLGEAAADAVRAVLASGVPAVFDADALRPGDFKRDAATVLTPHTGEFQHLTGTARDEAERDRLGVTRRAAADLGATVLLKGTTTVVAAPDGTAYVNPTGTPWLGTAGTGDVLSGVVAALLTRDPHDGARAAACAAWLHGLAGRLAAGGVAATALDVAEALPAAARIALESC
jgi:hydroxyethylthiazole kinase-like uncharacterized protein yjeF